jgi:hypothetical protein
MGKEAMGKCAFQLLFLGTEQTTVALHKAMHSYLAKLFKQLKSQQVQRASNGMACFLPMCQASGHARLS